MRKKTVHIDEIRAHIITNYPQKELIQLKDSPHYKFLCGDIKPYIDYLKIANQPDHSVLKYEKLIQQFSYLSSKYENDYIVCLKKDDVYIIQDGFHRACILLHTGKKEIDILYDNF